MSLRDDLDEIGYTVIRGLVPAEMCQRVVHAIEDRTELRVDDSSTWSGVTGAVPMWGHQSQWDIRQHPDVYEAWAEACGTRRLWANSAGCGFTPPWQPGGPDALPVHWDQDPRDKTIRFLQGTIALSNTPRNGGGFRCAPSWRNAPQRWPASWPTRPWGEVWEIEPPDDEIVQVEVEIGDAIIWESRLPHGTTRNLHTQPRLVFFLSFQPVGEDDEAVQRVRDFHDGLPPEHQRWKPEHAEPEPWPPATLTDLGQRLLGARPWS